MLHLCSITICARTHCHRRSLRSQTPDGMRYNPCCRYTYESVCVTFTLVAALLAADELDLLRELLTDTLMTDALTDEATRAGIAVFWRTWGDWKTEDGHRHSCLDTWLLVVRGLLALLEENTDASRATLQGWLPPPAELLRIAEYECMWRAHNLGANHPALLCARLYGERLASWDVAAEVAEGVLAIEEFQPLLRIEAFRLLGRARSELGDRAAACDAAERACVEAVRAKYVWLEMRSLNDLLQWCTESDEAESVQLRLQEVVGRMAVSKEELAGVLGTRKSVL